MKTTTWWIIGGVVFVVIVVALAAGSLRLGTPVEVAEARHAPIQEFVDERGMTRLPETYLITMPFSGRIEPITLVEGTRVEEGEQVAQIVPDDLELAVDRATAAVARLDASIAENRDNDLEDIALRQAYQFVESMAQTVAAAAKQVESAQAKLAYSKTNLERIQALRHTGASTEDDLDRAELEKVEHELAADQNELIHRGLAAMKVATDLMPDLIQQYVKDKDHTDATLQKQRDEAAAQLDQVELDQKRGTMASPVDGVVLKRFVTGEQALAAGTPLVEIGRPEDLEVEADILSLDVVNVKKGAPVKIYGPVIGKRLPDGKDYADGTVHKVYPAGFTKISSLGVEQQRVKVIIRFDAKDLQWLRRERDLGIGYRVRVRIITADKPDALVIPRSALFRGPDGNWCAYAIRNGRLRIQNVELGMVNDELAEVVAGLAVGDLVVRAPEGDLEEGQRVKAKIVPRPFRLRLPACSPPACAVS